MIDLHTHSCYSDGEYTPNEIILKAKKEGIKMISITDHDTVLGNQNITLTKEERLGIKIIPGIELSAKVPKGQMHILGYNIDIYDQNLNNKIKELKNNSFYSVIGILVQIKKDYGITFETDEILNILNSSGNIGRPDIAKLCIKHAYTSTVKEAFNKFLTPANEKLSTIKKGITYQECISLIRNAGGISVLAHPKTLECTDTELENIIKELKQSGLEGIEAYHSIHTAEEIKKYLSLADKYDLLISGGSDYHGPLIKPNIQLATGINNNIKVKKLTITEKL